jgi:hypothetical protein
LTVCTALSTGSARTGSQSRYYNTLYLKPTYEAAKKKLNLIKRELAILNQSAVYSLEEGMEETLSLHPFWVFSKARCQHQDYQLYRKYHTSGGGLYRSGVLLEK